MKTKLVDGQTIPIGSDPQYDYVRDFRRAKAFKRQEVLCCGCKQPMKSSARSVSPIYGTIGEVFSCENCKVEVSVMPSVEAS